MFRMPSAPIVRFEGPFAREPFGDPLFLWHCPKKKLGKKKG
jgi:hypothetical protein